MKYYAVKKGNNIGVFDNWDECEKSIKGYKGADYKSFKSKEEAEQFLVNDNEEELLAETNSIRTVDSLSEEEIIIYSDGSYDQDLKLSSYGVVYLQKAQPEYHRSGIVDDPNGSRQVIGEIKGVLEGLEYAKYKGKKKVYIYHDYEGLSKWITGEWKVKSSDSTYYVNEINKYKSEMELEFTKVKAHSGEKYNEICDKLAKNELKSLAPSTSDEWGFKSFRFSDEIIIKVLNKIKADENNFQYLSTDKNNHVVYQCFLGKEKLTFQKYKFISTNQLLIPLNQSTKIYSLLLTYLNEYNSTNSILRSLNVNNNTEVSEDLVKERLYSLAPTLKNKQINLSIYKLIVQAVYNLFLNVNDFKDCSFLTTPVLRALEGQLKLVFKEKLNIDIKTNNFCYFDKDLGTGIYSLQSKYVNQIDNGIVDYIDKCYNQYSKIRHKLLHFGDLDIDDTMTLSKEDSQQVIIKTIELIAKYY